MSRAAARSSALLVLAALASLATGCPRIPRGTTSYVDAHEIAAARSSTVPGTLYVICGSQTTPGVYRADGISGPWALATPTSPPQILRLLRADTLEDGVYVVGNSGTTDTLWRSDDRAATWKPFALPASVATGDETLLEPDPAVPGRVWLGCTIAGTTSAALLFRSDDRGATWTAASSGLAGTKAIAIGFDADPQTRLIATDSGVQRTQDAGLTWHAFGQGLPGSTPLALACDPKTPGKAAVTFADFASLRHLYLLDNGAWTEDTSYSPYDAGSPLAFDPTTPGRFYVGDEVTQDSGMLFQSLEVGSADRFVFDPSHPPRLFVGLYYTDDGGTTWTSLTTTGLPVITVQLKEGL